VVECFQRDRDVQEFQVVEQRDETNPSMQQPMSGFSILLAGVVFLNHRDLSVIVGFAGALIPGATVCSFVRF
jgi:hypothetical protein